MEPNRAQGALGLLRRPAAPPAAGGARGAADEALDALDLLWGQWLLVTGAAGALGGFAVLRGLRVVGAASADDEDLVQGLGDERLASRDGGRLTDQARALAPGGVDGALDASDVGLDAIEAVHHGRSYVSLLDSASRPRRDITTINLVYHSEGVRLAKVRPLPALAEAHPVAATLPLDQVSSAHARLEAGGLRGRLVMVP